MGYEEDLREAIEKGLEISYQDLCCRKNMHKMYHATKMPCPCKKVQERVRAEKWGKAIGMLMGRVVDYNAIARQLIKVEPLPEGPPGVFLPPEKEEEKP